MHSCFHSPLLGRSVNIKNPFSSTGKNNDHPSATSSGHSVHQYVVHEAFIDKRPAKARIKGLMPLAHGLLLDAARTQVEVELKSLSHSSLHNNNDLGPIHWLSVRPFRHSHRLGSTGGHLLEILQNRILSYRPGYVKPVKSEDRRFSFGVFGRKPIPGAGASSIVLAPLSLLEECGGDAWWQHARSLRHRAHETSSCAGDDVRRWYSDKRKVARSKEVMYAATWWQAVGPMIEKESLSRSAVRLVCEGGMEDSGDGDEDLQLSYEWRKSTT